MAEADEFLDADGTDADGADTAGVDEEELETPPVSTGVSLVAAAPGRAPEWRLRGDWESGNALLVAYDGEWEGPLVDLIHAASADVEVYVVANPDELSDHRFYAWLGRHSASVVTASHDTPWIRDYGPLQVRADTGEVGWLDFQYSVDRLLDDRIPTELARVLGVSVNDSPVWLDGGAVIANGQGLCAMTDDSVSTMGIDTTTAGPLEAFSRSLGCRALAVLPALPEEETGHADLIAQFVDSKTIVVSEAGQHDPIEVVDALEAATSILKEAAALLGVDLQVVRVPLRVRRGVFYSYVNFMRLPGRVLVPSYRAVGDKVEQAALDALVTAVGPLPIVSIPADEMAERGGAIHCVTLGVELPEPNPFEEMRLARAPSRRRWIGVGGTAR